MTIEQALLTKLLATPALTALTGQKIYYVKAPQNVIAPYLTYQKISEQVAHSHQGYSHLKECRIQFSAFSTTYMGAKAINAQIFAALDGLVGMMGGIEVGACLQEDEVDMYDAETSLHYCPVDYMITYYD